MIKGLHAGHWLSKKIEEIKNRRWRSHQKNQASSASPLDPNKPDYGKLSEEEVAKLQKCNMAFWWLYIQKKPSMAVLQKRQEQYNKKTAHNKTARALLMERKPAPSNTSTTTTTPTSTTTSGRRGAKNDIIYTKVASADSSADGGNKNEPHIVALTDPLAACASSTETPKSTDEMLAKYTQIVDPTAIERLEAIVKVNPVLLKIREYGPTAKREDVYPASNTLEAEEYVFTYLRSFPENTFGKAAVADTVPTHADDAFFLFCLTKHFLLCVCL